MPTVFFILLALFTASRALQQGTTNNDTTILTGLTLEDIFSSSSLDKRALPGFKKKKRQETVKVPLVKEDDPQYPHYPRWFIQVPLVPSQMAHAPKSPLPPNFAYKFQIDTYGACSSVPQDIDFFNKFWPGRGTRYTCPGRYFSSVPIIAGSAYRSRIPITIASKVTWEGRLIKTDAKSDHGTLGLSFSDLRVPKKLHTLPNLLKDFQSQVFALLFSEQGSELHIGGIEGPSDKIEYYKLVEGFPAQPWPIGHMRIFVGEELIVGVEEAPIVGTEPNTRPSVDMKYTAAFDSSTPYIYGPRSDVTKILDALSRTQPPALVYFQWEGKTQWPFTIGNRKWDDIFKPVNQMTNWVLGTEVFYSSGYYLVYALDKAMVGIGRSGPISLAFPNPSHHEKL